jgi:hypothetical protein
MTTKEKAKPEYVTSYLTMLRDCARHNMNLACVDGTKDWHYAGMGDFLLQHGVWMPPPEKLAKWQGKLKRCFHNSHVAAKRYGWKYCEGIAFGIIPVHHAWCQSPDGAVQEVTWRDPGDLYFGIAFDKIPEQPCVFDNWEAGDYEILQETV